MKNLTNILSYLWLLLLMAVTACSDLEEEVGPMQGEEEVELTIQTEVSGMKGSTRTAPTESITAITAYAFDSNSQLIKVVKAILSDDKQATSGNLRIKVPKRTGDIHFIAKNNAESPDVTISIGDNVSTLLSQTTDDLHYWGKATYNGGNNLSVTLIRNMAKVTLTLNNDLQGHIAGFVNYNQTGTLVPGNFEVGTLNATNDVASHSNGDLGTEHYLFEHANVENSNPLYVIIEVADKYYKVAFAAGDTYFPILRNRAYEITVTEPLDEMYAEADYPAAVNSQYPINDLVITSVPMTVTASPTEVLNESNQTFTVTVTIPGGITELNEPTHDAFDITPPNSLTPQNGKYTITEGNYDFTFTVKPDVEAGDKTISFSGRGKYKSATGSANIGLYDNVQLTVTADPATIYNTAGSTRNVTVTVPEGITTLTIPSATTDAFIVTPQNGLSANNDGSYTVSAGDYLFTLQLRTDGDVGSTKTVTFNGSGQYKRATGSTTLTLEQAPAQEILSEYELWVENSAWKGSTNYDTFFTWNGDISAGDASNLESTFYDDGANAHKSRHMVMGQNNSISFTIPDTRYLTLLVASNNGNTPSINLTGTLTDGTWATAGNTEDLTNGTYNFAAEGEITTAGRLIRYTLPAGTYTLQRGNNDYLLYYMRVSTSKPTMTDIVQPAAGDYSLSWSGNNGGYLKDPNNDAKYFVDEEATNFIPTLTYNGLSEVSLSTVKLDVTTDVWTFDNSNDSSKGSTRKETRNYTEANISSLAYNEGAYTLSGSVTGISGTSYKYATFYDNLQLKSVSFNVKNTVKVALYNSWDADAQPVTEFVEGGENNILGFKMPQHTLPVNPLNSEKINFTIDNSWQLNQSGAGIYQVGDSNYQIGDQQSQQDNQSMHYHPRKEWTYKMSWNNIPSKTITPTSTTDDVYFSYNGEISKNPTITTQGAETPLSIELDFYSAENRDNNVYEDLLLGTSLFYLKATISAEDAANYAGQNVTVTLNGEFGVTQGQGKWSINWDGSRNAENSSISSNSGATQLSFTIGYDNEGNPQTEYLIEWVFKTGQYYNAGEAIGFTYNISNYTISAVDGTFNNFTGDTSATIGFTNEPIGLEIYSDADTDGGAGITIASGDELVMKATVPSDIPVGTEITFDLSNSIDVVADGLEWNHNNTSSVQMNWPNITLTVEQGQSDYYLYWNPTVSGESRTATLSFTATIDDNSYNLNSVGNTSYSKTVTVTPNNNQTTGTVVWNEGKTYTDWSTDYIAVNTYIPTGSVITIYTSSTNGDGGAFEMHDIEERSLRFTNVNYPVNNDDYYSVASGETSHSFTVTNETTANGNSLANGVDGLKINGNNVTITRIVVQYPSMTGEVFNRSFEDSSTITSVWGAEESKYVSQKNVEGDDGNNYLVLANATGGGYAQASLDRAYVPGNYTLTYRIKVASSDLSKSIKQEFQYFNNRQQIYERVSVDSKSVSLNTTDRWQEVTLYFEVTRGCNRLLFDYSEFIGEIYIDDLRLVKND